MLLCSCSSSKPELSKVEPSISKVEKNTERRPSAQNRRNNRNNNDNKEQTDNTINKEVKKQSEKNDNQNKKINNQRQKESEKQKKAKQKQDKQKEKEKKNKEKQQEELIRRAAKEEKKRIEEERKKEKEKLLNNLKQSEKDEDNTEQNKKQIKKIIVDTTSATDTLKLEDVLVSQSDMNAIVKYNDTEEKEDHTPEFLKKFKKKKDDVQKIIPQCEKKQPVTTMEKVLHMMEEKNKVTDPADSTKATPLYVPETENKGNFIKKTYRKLFPKKIHRKVTYEKLYKEEPKNIFILYPYNRSEYEMADEMVCIMATKELGSKGYYVYSVIAEIEKQRVDSTLNSKTFKISDLKKIRETSGADAVLQITIFRFDNPHWSSATNAVAHYTMISTTTMDTLFERQMDFNYDSPIPPKDHHDRKLELDKEQVYDLGIIEQMQRYVFMAIPFGPYHKKYKKDGKRASSPKEIKKKITARPS